MYVKMKIELSILKIINLDEFFYRKIFVFGRMSGQITFLQP